MKTYDQDAVDPLGIWMMDRECTVTTVVPVAAFGYLDWMTKRCRPVVDA